MFKKDSVVTRLVELFSNVSDSADYKRRLWCPSSWLWTRQKDEIHCIRVVLH